jgi:hypothetical protein
MTSLAQQFDLIDPSAVSILPDGSTHVATVPPHSFLVGELLDGMSVSSAGDHAGARRVLYAAWLRVMGRPATMPEIQGVQAIALHETGYGQLGFFPKSHNWGAVQCPGTWGATACPAGCIMGKDSLPPAAGKTDAVTKPVCFRSYPEDVAGAVDLVRNLTTARPRTMKALATGDADQIAAAMYAERYYTGTSKVPAANIAVYAGGIARRSSEIAKNLHENVRVARHGSATPPAGIAMHLGTAVPLAALFGVIAFRRHLGIGDEPATANDVGAAETGDILPTFVTPADAKRYIRETDAQWDRTDSDIQASAAVDTAFKGSWATDLEGWRRFRDDAVNSVGWLNTKATMEQTDRWAAKLTAWRKALTDAGGKLVGPGPLAPGQGLGQGGTASAGWIQLALLIAALFGFGYLVRGFKA